MATSLAVRQPESPNARKIALLRAAMDRVALNHFGLPEGYYRTDLLPDQLSSEAPIGDTASTSRTPADHQSPPAAPSSVSADEDAVVQSAADAFSPSEGGSDGSSEGNLAGEPRPPKAPKAPNVVPFNKAAPSVEGISTVVEAEVLPPDSLTQDHPVVAPHLAPLSAPSNKGTLSELDFAYVPLAYVEGFPTQPDGRPFWAQLEFEPPDAYRMFELYLSQGRYGARQLFSLLPNLDGSARFRSPYLDPTVEGQDMAKLSSESDGKIASGLQHHLGLSPTLAPKEGPYASEVSSAHLLQQLQDAYFLYYWEVRARSYDLFYAASLRKARENQALMLEEAHYLKATRLFSLLNDKVFNNEEFWATMNAKTAVDFLKTLVTWQRISIGLPANGPTGKQESELPQGASFELILRQMAKGTVPQRQDNSGPNETASLDLLLQDPSTASLAQELIIRMTGGMK